MKRFIFERTQLMPIPLEQAWAFFSNPVNLAKITPASLDFNIVSKVPEHIYNDLKIEYTVKPLLGIPMTWISLIKDVDSPYQFVDEQLKGPYAYWHHVHIFSKVEGGTMARDIVTYSVPFGIFSTFIQASIVAPKLNEIFEFRRQTIEKLFGKMPNHEHA